MARLSWALLKAFAMAPSRVGTIAPSSKHLANRLFEAAQVSPASVVLEIGPGTGALTKPLLEILNHPSQYWGVEIYARFVEDLRQKFPGAHFEVGSAESLTTILSRVQAPQIQSVVASLPWALLPPEMTLKIFDEVRNLLPPEGHFSTFLYLTSLASPRSTDVLAALPEFFVELSRSEIVWANLPPAMIIRGKPRK
jgi:phosphatidylethanolamine/phosphatidyl-N-methylethanolamine N-methyltransferase